MLPCPAPFPLNLFSLPEGFPFTHTIWWEFLQLHTFLLFGGIFCCIYCCTQATQWLKTRNVYLLAPASVGQWEQCPACLCWAWACVCGEPAGRWMA